MTWKSLTPKPEMYTTTDSRGRKTEHWRTDPVLVNLDHVAIIQAVQFRDRRHPDNDEPINGSRLIWHGSSPRTEWVVFESPAQILSTEA